MEDVAKLYITGICETRWVGNEDFTNEKSRNIVNRNEKDERNGVAVILRRKWKDYVLNTYHVNDRIMNINLET